VSVASFASHEPQNPTVNSLSIYVFFACIHLKGRINRQSFVTFIQSYWVANPILLVRKHVVYMVD
jgi:hypothetical protein